YDYSVVAGMRMGQGLDQDMLSEFAAELMLAGQFDTARKNVLAQLIEANPDAYDALVLAALVDEHNGHKAEAERLRDRARNALLKNLAQWRAALGVTDPTTQPAEGGMYKMPNFDEDAPHLKKADPRAKEGYAAAVAELGWFEAYFANRTEEAEQLLAALGRGTDGVDPDRAALAARLQGWF